ncbi:MAG: NAD-dependent epimerase/dehydratase family protein [Pseudomonadota bacterium]
MNVLVLGGTGSIGAPVVKTLVQRGHTVSGLARSEESSAALASAGARPVEGSILNPDGWLDELRNVDAVIHAAAVWGDDMTDIDSRVVHSLLRAMPQYSDDKTLLYTGGCWHYGATGDVVADESTPYVSFSGFDVGLQTMQAVLSAQSVRGMVIHPAMVYERDGGVFDHFYNDADELGHVRVIGNADVRWPLVHRDDLALVYTLMVEQGQSGDVYNAATQSGVRVGDIASAVARSRNLDPEARELEVSAAIEEFGFTAEGYAIDQQMSGDKARAQLGWQPVHENVFDVIG